MARVLKLTTDCAFHIRRGLSRSQAEAKPPAEGMSKLKQAGRTIKHVKVPNAKDDVKEYSVLEDEEFQKKRLSSMELEIDELKRDLANFKMEIRLPTHFQHRCPTAPTSQSYCKLHSLFKERTHDDILMIFVYLLISGMFYVLYKIWKALLNELRVDDNKRTK